MAATTAASPVDAMADWMDYSGVASMGVKMVDSMAVRTADLKAASMAL